MKQHEQLKALYVERAKEAAKNYGLHLDYFISGPWVEFDGKLTEDATGYAIVVSVKARGWKNASDAFVKAATEWYQNQWVERVPPKRGVEE